MIASTTKDGSQPAHRITPWLAILSGVLGIFSFGCLIAYILTPTLQMQDSGVVSRAGRLLLTAQFLSSMIQALLLIPVAVWLSRMAGWRLPDMCRSQMVLGVVALGGVGLLRLVAVVDTAVSDILFMVPMGLVGVWLVFVNWNNMRVLPYSMRVLGGVAGVCLLGVGLNFFLNGGLGIFSKGPMAYGDDVNFHIGLGLSGLPGFTLFPVWSILLGFRLLRQPSERQPLYAKQFHSISVSGSKPS